MKSGNGLSEELNFVQYNGQARLLTEKKKTEEKLLLDDLHRLCKLENENPGLLSEQIKIVKSKIAGIEVEKYQGAIVRAQAAKYILGEQPTKRALSAEAKHVREKNIVEIEYGGLPSSDPEIIEKSFIEDYRNLF